MRDMRKKFITVIAIVLATAIAITACKAKMPSNETLTPDSTHPRGVAGAIDD